MSKLTVSIACGNPSPKAQERAINVDHDNRKDLTPEASKRIIHERSDQNITFVKRPIEEVYEQLFANSIKEYNDTLLDKKKNGGTKNRNKTLYTDAEAYLKKLENSKQEKPYYGSIITFGNMQTTGVGTENEAVAKKMLGEYLVTFQKRNPNLKIFNAVLHLDEATPHLHLCYVPFCHNTGKNGLSIKNSLTGALAEQGFGRKADKSKSGYQLVEWLVSERKVMTDILKMHGFELDELGEKREHQSHSEYVADKKKAKVMQMPNEEIIRDRFKLAEKNERLAKLVTSKIVTIDVPNYEKLEQVTEVLSSDKNKNIPWNVVGKTVTVPAYAEKIVTDSLANFTPTPQFNNLREQLKFDIDKNIYHSKDFEDFQNIMRESGYTVERRGQFLRFKPPTGQRFIRIDKSLGDEYTEEKIKERIAHKMDFCLDYKKKFETSSDYQKPLCGTIYNVTVLHFKKKLEPKKFNPKKPYTHANEKRIVKLIDCLKFIDENKITLSNLQSKIDALDERQTEIYRKLKELKNSNSPLTNKLENELADVKNNLKKCLELSDITEDIRNDTYLDKFDDKFDDTSEKEVEEEIEVEE
ncbi:hypothetical protein FACS1894132_12900 [Clostridia bacterium]|nr:hypothetical protein FACS1894132_12900 [Clostridia bacterium]